MQDKKQKEETFIDKTDFMERMEVALYPDYRIDQSVERNVTYGERICKRIS